MKLSVKITASCVFCYHVVVVVQCTVGGDSYFEKIERVERNEISRENYTFCESLMFHDYGPPDPYSLNPYFVNASWISPKHIRIAVVVDRLDLLSASMSAYTFTGLVCQVRYLGLPHGTFKPERELRLLSCSPGTKVKALSLSLLYTRTLAHGCIQESA